MSNDKSAASNDLSLDLESEDANDSSADDAERSDELENEDSEDAGEDLNLDSKEDQDEDKAKKRAAAIEQHAKSWASKIVLGKATLADVPANLKYLIPEIKAKLNLKEEKKEEPKTSREEVMAIVRFETLKEKVQGAYRTKQQNSTLNSEFKDALAHGYSPEQALKKAIKEADIDLSGPAEMPKVKTGDVEPRTRTQKVYDGSTDPNKMPRKQRLDAVRAMRAERGV